MRRNIVKMYLYHFFMGCFLVGGVLVPFFTDWGGISFSKITLLQTVYVIGVFLFGIPSGVVADYFGRKICLVISALAMVGAVLVYTSVPNFGVFVAGELLWALSVALLYAAGQALVYDTLCEERREGESKKILGRYEGSFMFGLLISAPIGSVIAYSIGLRETMLFMSVPMFFACIVALTLKEPVRRRVSVGQERKPKNTIALAKSGAKFVISDKAIRALALNRVLIGAPLFMMVWIAQPVLKEIGVSLLYFGVVQAIWLGVEIFCATKFEFLEKIFGSSKRYIFISAALPAILFMAVPLVYWILPLTFLSRLVIIFLLVLIVGFGLPRKILLQNYIHKHANSENRATVISGVSMANAAFEAICYTAIGFLVEWSLWYSLILLGAFILVAARVLRVKEEYLIN